MIEPRLFKGTRDYLPKEMIRREDLLVRIKEIFRKYGFQPLETPAIEFMDILLGKYGEEGEKLIYPLSYKGGHEVALRYDLTVPLARVMAMNSHLPKPFKRYQIQPVWRADKPQLVRGRFREFIQCDVDILGTRNMLADAEIIALSDEILGMLGFPNYRIRLNHRRLLGAMVRAAGLSEEKESVLCRAIDKIDKIGMDRVSAEMEQEGITGSGRDRILELLSIDGTNEDLLRTIGREIGADASGIKAVEDLRRILGYLDHFGVDASHIQVDLYLARGLDYYTGPIFETVLPDHPHIGSLAGGGRYDELIGMFSREDIPATGTTIGLDRILTALDQVVKQASKTTRTEVLVCNFEESDLAGVVGIVGRLRRAGWAVEMYYEPLKLRKQFAFADKTGIPLVLVPGPDELARGEVTIKYMPTGRQVTIPISDLDGGMRRFLADPNQ